MQIAIRGHETELKEDVKKYAREKMSKLSKYGVKIIAIDVTLEEDHNKTESKAAQARILIQIAGYDISLRGEGKHLFAAIDEAERKAKRELTQRKEKFGWKSRIERGKEKARRFLKRS